MKNDGRLSKAGLALGLSTTLLVAGSACSRVQTLRSGQTSRTVPFSEQAQQSLQSVGITTKEINAGYVLDSRAGLNQTLERYATVLCERLPKDLRANPAKTLITLESLRDEPTLAPFGMVSIEAGATQGASDVKAVGFRYGAARLAQQIRTRVPEVWNEYTVNDSCKELGDFTRSSDLARNEKAGTTAMTRTAPGTEVSAAARIPLEKDTAARIIAASKVPQDSRVSKDSETPQFSLFKSYVPKVEETKLEGTKTEPSRQVLDKGIAEKYAPEKDVVEIRAPRLKATDLPLLPESLTTDPRTLIQTVLSKSNSRIERIPNLVPKFSEEEGSSNQPVPPPAPRGRVVSITAGPRYTCAVVEVPNAAGASGTNRKLKCWGMMPGDYTDTIASNPIMPQMERAAVTVTKSGLSDVRSVSAARISKLDTFDRHTCAVTGDQGISCWGGQMGMQVPLTGYLSNLAPIGALRSIFGSPSIYGVIQNVAIPLVASGGVGVGSIESDGSLTCAVQKTASTANGALPDQRALCWGDPAWGNTTFQNPTHYSRFVPGARSPEDFTAPFVMPGIDNAGAASTQNLKLAAGGGTFCFLREGGQVWCMGGNSYGVITDPLWTYHPGYVTGSWRSSGDVAFPTLIPAVSGASDLEVSVRGTACAVVAGKVRCWGYNSDLTAGVVGPTGATVSQGAPWSCTTPPTYNSGPYCTALYVPATTPSQIGQISNATSVHLSQMGGWSCAIESGGSVTCWGGGGGMVRSNYFSAPPANSGMGAPRRLTAVQDPVEQLAVGGNHACAVVKNGTEILCFGEKLFGAVGDGTDPSVGEQFNGTVYTPGAVRVSGLFD